MDRDVAAGKATAGRISVAHVDGEEVVRPRIAIVGRIHAKADSFLFA